MFLFESSPWSRGISAAAVSDVGRVRENNEDNYLLGSCLNAYSSDRSESSASFSEDAWHIAAVFDGIGGGEAGELAARGAALIFQDAAAQLPPEASENAADRCLRRAFLDANNHVVALQREYRVFGTTAAVLCVKDRQMKVYHLGDSRAYLFREGILTQLTRDQTLARMKLDMGAPVTERDRHILTEYIGRDRTCAHIRPIESPWISLTTGDILLLCSDGLYDMCTVPEMTEILGRNTTPAEKVAALTEKALENGGEDNITCIVLCVG